MPLESSGGGENKTKVVEFPTVSSHKRLGLL
jgi:hypothetical protein